MSLSDLARAIVQKRTNNIAVFDGKEITGCGDCGNNVLIPGVFAFAPTHKCIISESGGELKIIYDPFNIPDDCPIKRSK